MKPTGRLSPPPRVCLVTPTASKLGGWRGEAECGPSELKWSSLTSVSFKSPPANRRHSGSLDVIHSSEEQKVQEEDLMSGGLINCSLMSRSVFWIFSFSVATYVCVTSVIWQTCSEINYFNKRSAENRKKKCNTLVLPGPKPSDALQLKVKAFVWFFCLSSTEWCFMFLCSLLRWKEPFFFIWTKVLTLTSKRNLVFSS